MKRSPEGTNRRAEQEMGEKVQESTKEFTQKSAPESEQKSRLPKLSERLGALFDLIPACAIAVDVGCDHGYIPIALVESGKCQRAVACDINRGPLEKAQENIAAAGLSGQIKTVLSNGLRNPEIYDLIRVPDAALIIAGMGGLLMIDILTNAVDLDHTFSSLILQPQSDVSAVRLWLAENGWKIHSEFALTEDGKYYEGILVRKQVQTEAISLTSEEAWFGPELLKSRNPVTREHILKQKQIRLAILEKLRDSGDARAAARRDELLGELEIIEKGLRREEFSHEV
ncbi:MAG: SAM-dependent methyltransferase [Lachnospiraceae bacterium]|nr:SAM-dependent methyltransferase [Lachnospiraceae bacterium]